MQPQSRSRTPYEAPATPISSVFHSGLPTSPSHSSSASAAAASAAAASAPASASAPAAKKPPTAGKGTSTKPHARPRTRPAAAAAAAWPQRLFFSTASHARRVGGRGTGMSDGSSSSMASSSSDELEEKQEMEEKKTGLLSETFVWSTSMGPGPSTNMSRAVCMGQRQGRRRLQQPLFLFLLLSTLHALLNLIVLFHLFSASSNPNTGTSASASDDWQWQLLGPLTRGVQLYTLVSCACALAGIVGALLPRRPASRHLLHLSLAQQAVDLALTLAVIPTMLLLLGGTLLASEPALVSGPSAMAGASAAAATPLQYLPQFASCAWLAPHVFSSSSSFPTAHTHAHAHPLGFGGRLLFPSSSSSSAGAGPDADTKTADSGALHCTSGSESVWALWLPIALGCVLFLLYVSLRITQLLLTHRLYRLQCASESKDMTDASRTLALPAPADHDEDQPARASRSSRSSASASASAELLDVDVDVERQSAEYLVSMREK